MALVYRSEKKKILRSQLHLIEYVLASLDTIEELLSQSSSEQDLEKPFTNILIRETEQEKQERAALDKNTQWDAEKKAQKINKWENQFYYRRLINSWYFKQLKETIIDNRKSKWNNFYAFSY